MRLSQRQDPDADILRAGRPPRPSVLVPGDPSDVQGLGEAEASVYTCEVVTSMARLDELEAAWTALHAAAHGAYLSESFAWASIAWNVVAAGRGRTLLCVLVRRGPELVAAWPLVLSRQAIWRIATPLTSETSEYCPFLIHPAADPNRVWSAIRGALGAGRDVDALRLPNVREDGPLGLLLSDLPGAVRLYSQPAPVLRRSSFADWESFRGGLSKNQRRQLRRERQRLCEHGDVQFEEITDPAERQSVWRWMIARKRAWLADRGLRCDWMVSDSYARFVAATLDEFGAGGGRRIFALKVNGALVAAKLDSVDRVRVESFVATFDERFSRCSPGSLLREEGIRWAFERDLDYDHRLGAEPFKLGLATHVPEATTYALALTPGGKLFVAYIVARSSEFGNRLELLRYRSKAWLRRQAVGRGA